MDSCHHWNSLYPEFTSVWHTLVSNRIIKLIELNIEKQLWVLNL